MRDGASCDEHGPACAYMTLTAEDAAKRAAQGVGPEGMACAEAS